MDDHLPAGEAGADIAAPLSYSGITAVERTIDVLEAMAGLKQGVSVIEISRILGVEKSVVSRILTTLRKKGYVHQDELSGRYSLSFRLVALAYRHTDSIGFPEFCLPVLERLSAEIGELVQLALVSDEGVVLGARAEGGTHTVRVESRLGRMLPLHASSSGKVWLASLPEEQALTLVAQRGLPALTARTITSLEGFADELRRVRELGYATNEEERETGLNAIAVPIEVRGSVVGAVLVAGPAPRFSRRVMVSWVPLLQDAARELAQVWPSSIPQPFARLAQTSPAG